jgi:hypothetical protein
MLERKTLMPTNAQQPPQDADRAAHWPNPAGEYATGSETQRKASEDEDDATRLERTDAESLHSAAPGDGTGVTGTVSPT